MKKIVLLSALLAISSALTAQEVQGPDGALKVNVELKDGNPIYSVHYNNKIFLEPSPLGLKTSIGDFSARLKQLGHQVRTIDETYTMPHAKVSRVHYQANELVCNYLNEKGDTLQVIFRVSNNDIAQAYRISSPKHTHCIIEKETTGFDFPSYTTTFITPQAPAGDGWMGTKPSYEEEYTLDEAIGTPSRYKLGYTFPALFHVGNDGWVLVSETGVSSHYAGTKLSEGTQDGLYTIAFPEKAENGGVGDATIAASIPSLTSWKTITVGETLKPIVETTSAYDNVRPFYEPTQVYQPGRSTWSWILWQDASCNYKDQQTFIDLAAAMGYEYILIDALWDKQIGYENMPSLIAYAQSKGVDVLLWYNSNGSCNDAPQGPKHRLDSAPARQKEMAWMKALGVKGIKVDFFGGDKQATMKLYEDILTDANQYGIAVVFHGCTLPRGWERMYPNYVGSEAVLASENMVFNQHFCDKEAFNACLHPFIRNTVGSMDFGGSALNKYYNSDNAPRGSRRMTSDVFALATAVLFQSPVQHFALAPNNLTDAPEWAIGFMKEVPTTWDEVRFIDGYPGKYVVMARRHGDKWYIAGVNAQKETVKLKIALPMFMPGNQVRVFSDNEELQGNVKQVKVNKKQELQLTMPCNGGILIVE